VRATRRDSDQCITCGDGLTIDYLFALNGADAKSCQVVFTIRIHVRHLGRFATDQGSASLVTSFGNACDHTGCNLDVKPPAGEVIEEKQRFRALNEHVIRAHGDEIDADRVMLVQLMGQHQLGADTVGAGYQDRFPVAARRQGKEATKATKACKHFGPLCAFDERLDTIDEIVAGVDINSGILIGQRLHRRYNSAWASTGKPPLLKLRWTVLVLAFVTSPVWAVEAASLYSAQVPFDQEENDPRARAYELALADVLLRVSGSELSSDVEMVELLFPNPASYVVQFRPGADETLWVSFDGDAIENTLRRAGQTVWGSDRPLTLIWLAVDWGQGRREIIAADDPVRSRDEARSIDRNRLLRQRVLDIAERRGLPVAFPLLDTIDLQNLSFSDIWGGFDDALISASERYEADAILVGRVRPASSQRNRWSFYFGGEERTWNGEPELVISQVADLLAAEFAISGSAVLETVDVTIAGIDSVEAFGAVQNLLTTVTVIEQFSIAEVEGDRIRYRIAAIGGADRLSRALRFSGLIEQNGFEGDRIGFDPYEQALEFFYSP